VDRRWCVVPRVRLLLLHARLRRRSILLLLRRGRVLLLLRRGRILLLLRRGRVLLLLWRRSILLRGMRIKARVSRRSGVTAELRWSLRRSAELLLLLLVLRVTAELHRIERDRVALRAVACTWSNVVAHLTTQTGASKASTSGWKSVPAALGEEPQRHDTALRANGMTRVVAE
jgi:hypothetical protein